MRKFRIDFALELLRTLPFAPVDQRFVEIDLFASGLKIAIAVAELVTEWGIDIVQHEDAIWIRSGQSNAVYAICERYDERKRQARKREAEYEARSRDVLGMRCQSVRK